MSGRPIIAVDVDDVVADLIGEWLRRYNEAWQDNLTHADIRTWDIDKHVKPECGKSVFTILGDSDLYDCIKPLPDALETIERLREIGRVIFVTSCGGPTRDAKYKWLRTHGFLKKDQHADYITAKDKWLINANVLVDDGIHNVNAFGRYSVLLTRPHNVNVKAAPWVRRAAALKDVPWVVASLTAV